MKSFAQELKAMLEFDEYEFYYNEAMGYYRIKDKLGKTWTCTVTRTQVLDETFDGDKKAYDKFQEMIS